MEGCNPKSWQKQRDSKVKDHPNFSGKLGHTTRDHFHEDNTNLIVTKGKEVTPPSPYDIKFEVDPMVTIDFLHFKDNDGNNT